MITTSIEPNSEAGAPLLSWERQGIEWTKVASLPDVQPGSVLMLPKLLNPIPVYACILPNLTGTIMPV